MKFLLSIFLIFCGLAQAENNHELGIVKDRDGFTNIRSQPDLKSDILGTVPSNRMLYFQRFDESWLVINRYAWGGYRDGFIHSSRVFPIMELGIQDIEPVYGQEWRTEKKLIMLNEIEITLFNADRIEESYDFPMYHSSYLEIKVPNQKPIRKYYVDMDPVGDSAGINYVRVASEPNRRFFIKFGDYEGRIIIVAQDGRVADFEGGQFWIYRNLLISEAGGPGYEGSIVWDLDQWKLVYRMEDNPDIYAKYGNEELLTTYYLDAGTVYLKITPFLNEDLPSTFYRLERNGNFVPEPNPPSVGKILEAHR